MDGTYQVSVLAPDSTEIASASFTVDDVAFQAASVAPTPFYPFEVDHNRDLAHISFRTDLAAADTIRIFNHKSHLVRSVSLGTLAGGVSHTWAWDGRTAGGLVNPGSFTIHITAQRGVGS